VKGKLLLTGGGGMVGRNLLDHPDIAHWQVDAPDRAALDLTDFAATAAYIARSKPDVIVHAAGLVGGIHTNMARMVDFLVTNLDIGRNVVVAARAAGVPRLLNLGSSCMYPRDAPSPLSEDMILSGSLEPTNEGYALAKIVAARLCQFISRETPSLRYRTFVPCNLYGRHDKFGADVSHLVPAIIAKVAAARDEGRDTVEVWGDGTARREFMFAGDLASAIMRALDDFDPLPEIMNVGPGHDHSIMDYYELAADVIGWRGAFVHDLTKPVGMKQKMVNTTRQSAWGWAPATSLRDGLLATYEHYRSGSAR
jgi:GDP-L-fucose synthase